MRLRITIASVVLIVALLAGCTFPFGPGRGYGPGGMGPGMMGPGITGPQQPYPGAPRITLDQAVDIALSYAAGYGLKANEVMEFTDNFYVPFSESDTGMGAFESLIDPYNGTVYPEPGPNMMWNTKYGMMGRGMMGNRAWLAPGSAASPTTMTVSPEQASKLAADFLKSYLPGSTFETPDTFYGYYTLHVIKDGHIFGMLSVNGYTGQVWYHTWHGTFVAVRELG